MSDPAGPAQSPTDSPTSTWDDLSTESRHPESHDLDALTPSGVVSLMLREDQRGIDAALALTDQIAAAATRFAHVYEGGGTVVMLGAGTSGRLGVLEASECPPTFGTDPERIRAEIAGGSEAVFRAAEGAEDRREDGEAAVSGLGSGDLLLAITASGVTPYVRAALERARERGAQTVLLTCARPSPELAELADQVLALHTGPEILTGSTRLKAGSATKAVLNAISTTAMVMLGKVYENLMVDLRPGSQKLRARSVRIVVTATGSNTKEAEALLRSADGEVKTAIVMARSKRGVDDARRLLNENSGSVRRALAAIDET